MNIQNNVKTADDGVDTSLTGHRRRRYEPHSPQLNEHMRRDIGLPPGDLRHPGWTPFYHL